MSIVDPNILELLQHSDSRYTLVVEASKRGRQIVGGSQASVYSIGTGEDKKATVNIAGGVLSGEGYSFRANEQSVVSTAGILLNMVENKEIFDRTALEMK